jgi:pilus assembly protein CpaF
VNTVNTGMVPDTVAEFRSPRIDRRPSRSNPMLSNAGPLSSLLADASVTDVLVNGADVWIDRGDGLARADVTLGSPVDVRRLAQRLAAACGRRLDEASPYVDARLPDGTRLHAVLPPVATDGPYLSLRTFRYRAFSLPELIRCGSVDDLGAALLSAIVEARLSYLVSGGTGSGKTTLLSSMLGLVPHHERIVVVEDAPEIRPNHPHMVGLSARTANVEGAGAVTMRDLVRQALRMRPDRLVIGECRGAEVVDLLGALNTGHEGGAGTLHANTAADAPARLEALGLLSGVPRVALHAQIAAALQIVVHMRRLSRGRVLDEIVLLRPEGPERMITSVPAWHRLTGTGPGAVGLSEMLIDRGVRPPEGFPLPGGTPGQGPSHAHRSYWFGDDRRQPRIAWPPEAATERSGEVTYPSEERTGGARPETDESYPIGEGSRHSAWMRDR